MTAYCRDERASLRRRIELFLQVCRAVAYAHRNLVVHRDIKPANILVAADGTVKLLDFGIAKLLGDEMQAFAEKTLVRTRTDQAMMTPQYASPEQYLKNPITTATDVYGLGLLLYELLTGFPAYDFSDKSLVEIDRMIVHDPPLNPSTAISRFCAHSHSDFFFKEKVEGHARHCGTTPEKLSIALRGELDHIILKALRKEPERRYVTVEALADDLSAFLDGRPVSAHADSLWYRARKFARRHAKAVAAFASFLVLLSLLTVVSLRFAMTTKRQARLIAVERDRAEQVSSFLVDIFESADPFVESASDLTVDEVLKRSAGRIDTEFQDQPQLRARLLTLMGQAYTATGDYDTGRAFLDRALAVTSKEPDTCVRERAECLGQIGETLRLQGRWEEAEDYFHRALLALEQLGGADHLRADITFKSATNFLDNRRFDQALSALQRAQSLLDLDAQDGLRLQAKIFDSTARAHQEMNDFTQADAYQQRAIELAEQAFGTDHAHTGNMLANRAIILDALGQDAEAQQVFDRALTMLTRILGDDHPLIATLYNNLGMLLEGQGKLEQALEAHQKALAMRREIFGADNAYVIMSLINIGYTLDSMQHYARAETYYRQAIDIGGRVFATNHPDLGFLFNNYCYNLQSQGKWEAAADACQHAYDIYRQAPGHDIAAGQTAALLGKVLIDAERFESAITVLTHAIEVADNAGEPQLIPKGRVLNNLGRAHLGCGNWVEAEAAFRRGYRINMEQHGPDHPDTSASKRGLDQATNRR